MTIVARGRGRPAGLKTLRSHLGGDGEQVGVNTNGSSSCVVETMRLPALTFSLERADMESAIPIGMLVESGKPFTVPVDIATESIALLGQRGSGKSNAEVVFTEELYDAGIPWVAIDAKGD